MQALELIVRRIDANAHKLSRAGGALATCYAFCEQKRYKFTDASTFTAVLSHILEGLLVGAQFAIRFATPQDQTSRTKKQLKSHL